MKRVIPGVAALVASVSLVASPLAAQVYVGANATLPQGDYKEYAKTGWMATAGYGFWSTANEALTVWAEGAYGQNSHEGDHGEKTKLLMVSGAVTYSFSPGANTSPYLLGSVGYLSHSYDAGDLGDFDASESGIGIGAGGGVGFGKFFVEARYVMGMGDLDDTKFLMVGAGILF